MTLVAALGLARCGIPEPDVPRDTAVRLPDRVLVRSAGRVVAVPLEEYVLGSTLAEVTPVNESPATIERIYEVQAVLARTYAASHLGRHHSEGFDVCDSTHCQLYAPGRIMTSRFAAAARSAVQRTTGVVLTYSGRPVEALFHADCGGSTAAADAVWGGPPVPYLKAARDDVPAASHRSWKVLLTADELRTALNVDPRSRVGRRFDGLEVRDRDVSGRAARIAIEGERSTLLSGEAIRAILNQTLGDRAVQSTRLTITKVGTSYRIDGQGFGHGVGLCQIGAAARARQGDSLEAILGAYFKGARLRRAG